MLASPPTPPSADPVPAAPRRHDTVSAASIAQDLADNPDLEVAYGNLKAALADAHKRKTILQVLRALAQPDEPPTSEIPS